MATLTVLASAAPSVIATGGLLVGIVVGLTGMGGGALLTPFLVLGLGLPANVAVSSDLVVSLAMKPVGAFTHNRRGGVRRDIVRWLAYGSVPAAFIGAAAVNLYVSDSGAKRLEPAIGVTLLVAATFMILRVIKKKHPSSADVPVRALPTLVIGILGGLLVGFTSVGSGSLMLVLLGWCYPALAGSTLVGTDLAQAVPLVAAATAGHLLFGHPSVSLILPLLVGALPGVWFGAKIAHRVPDKILRPVLAFVLTVSGLKLLKVL
jgi:uncharacterized protein